MKKLLICSVSLALVVACNNTQSGLNSEEELNEFVDIDSGSNENLVVGGAILAAVTAVVAAVTFRHKLLPQVFKGGEGAVDNAVKTLDNTKKSAQDLYDDAENAKLIEDYKQARGYTKKYKNGPQVVKKGKGAFHIEDGGHRALSFEAPKAGKHQMDIIDSQGTKVGELRDTRGAWEIWDENGARKLGHTNKRNLVRSWFDKTDFVIDDEDAFANSAFSKQAADMIGAALKRNNAEKIVSNHALYGTAATAVGSPVLHQYVAHNIAEAPGLLKGIDHAFTGHVAGYETQALHWIKEVPSLFGSAKKALLDSFHGVDATALKTKMTNLANGDAHHQELVKALGDAQNAFTKQQSTVSTISEQLQKAVGAEKPNTEHIRTLRDLLTNEKLKLDLSDNQLWKAHHQVDDSLRSFADAARKAIRSASTGGE